MFRKNIFLIPQLIILSNCILLFKYLIFKLVVHNYQQKIKRNYPDVEIPHSAQTQTINYLNIFKELKIKKYKKLLYQQTQGVHITSKAREKTMQHKKNK